MIGSPCLAVGLLMGIAAVLFVLISLVLIFIILLQRGKGGGLSAALGGGMASGLLGSKTGDVLTWVTIVLAGLFLLISFAMAKYYKPSPSQVETPAPVTQQQPASSSQADTPGPNGPAR